MTWHPLVLARLQRLGGDAHRFEAATNALVDPGHGRELARPVTRLELRRLGKLQAGSEGQECHGLQSVAPTRGANSLRMEVQLFMSVVHLCPLRMKNRSGRLGIA
jgi:hypothetical protein